MLVAEICVCVEGEKKLQFQIHPICVYCIKIVSVLPVNVHVLRSYIHGLLVKLCVFCVVGECTDKGSLSVMLI